MTNNVPYSIVSAGWHIQGIPIINGSIASLPVDIEDARILPLIQAIADENNSLFGYQKMTYALNNNSDVKYNRKRIYRIMAINGIESHFRIDRRHSTYRKSTPQETKDNVLDRDFNAEAPNTNGAPI